MEGNEQNSAEELLEKGRYYCGQGQTIKAKEIFERVLEIQTKELGGDDPSLAITLNHIGAALLNEENYDEAMGTLERALGMQLGNLGATDADIGRTYESIGRVSLGQGNYEKAEVLFRIALNIKLELPATHMSDLMDVCHNLVVSLQMQGKVSDAVMMQKGVLAKQLEMHGEDHPEVVKLYVGIAVSLKTQTKLNKALQMLDKGIEVCSRLQRTGDFDADIFEVVLLSKALCLQRQENFEGATEVFTELLMFQKETLGEIRLSTAQTYESLALLYARQDMTDDAIKAYANAIHVFKTVLGDDYPKTKELAPTLKLLKREKIAKTLRLQGLEMKAQGDLANSVLLFQEAQIIYKEIHTAHPSPEAVSKNIYAANIDIAASLELFSAWKVDQGLLEDAITVSADALKIRRRTLGDDHTDTKERMEVHRSLLKRLLENRS
ncbi:unnamed protein product [Cylindrotheca closterium]|uniref:MalT-like TPR region domain-containing protein n=1 Tax=Cylindrotheca closterium TaxID=2856 RepID=A0AAD2FL30_9STRA|nr:unnamed protein product [Cylindrotheca closterium]